MNPRQAWLAAPFLALALAPLLTRADELNMVKLHVDRFTVIGFEARTTNAEEMSGKGVISQFWGRLQSEQFLSHIPSRVDSRVIAVYSNYESDKDGPYTYMLGAKVSSSKDIPPGMVARDVPSGPYAMFTAQGDAPAQMVVELWRRIWSLEKPDQLHRAYKTDYEVYYQMPDAPATTHVDVYIGVKEKRSALHAE